MDNESKNSAISELDLLDGDSEGCHVMADKILLQYLRQSGSAEVADAWERLRDRVGFWYA